MAAEAKHAGISANKILIIEKAPEHSFTIKNFIPIQNQLWLIIKEWKQDVME